MSCVFFEGRFVSSAAATFATLLLLEGLESQDVRFDGGYVPMIQYPSIKGETDGTGPKLMNPLTQSHLQCMFIFLKVATLL